jgi:diguanylate cyclase
LEYGQTVEQASEYARSAIESMRRLGIPANPNNFTVWFNYFTGAYPDLRRTIDILLDNKQEFTEARSTEIFHRFFTFDGEGCALNDASSKLATELANILKLLEDAGGSTENYGRALAAYSGQLASSHGGTDLKSVIGNLLNATRAMENQNRTLENRLSASSQEIDQLRQDLETMRREALTDALTGIANRKVFDAQLRKEAMEAMESGEDLSLLMIDIDHFKRFNDTYGHQTGDQVLKLLAATLTECTKHQDTAARYGGEEFAVILPRTRLAEAAAFADKLRQRIGSKTVMNRKTGEKLGRMTVSIGVGRYEFGEPLSQLIQRTDQALYAAKRNGRDQVLTQDAVKDSELMLGG